MKPTALQEMILRYDPFDVQEREDRRMMLSYIELFDNILCRDNEIAHFTASSWIVNPDRSRVLMAFHNIYKSWAWTGGHADGDQDLLRVALREAREETGLEKIRPLAERPSSLEIIPVDPHFRKGRFVPAHLHLNLTYILEADDSCPTRVKPDENTAVTWFYRDEAVEKSSEPEMKSIYRKLIGRSLLI